MSKVIVFGAFGQLGQCLQQVTKQHAAIAFIFLPEDKANILDAAGLEVIFEEHQPAYCINCAAYTAVDKAEEEEELARQVNRDGVENLAKLCSKYDTTLIHISTDFVFAGTGNEPLTEEDATTPVNAYGLTKLEGEQAVTRLLERYFILRTSWLYSEYGNNFVKTMIRLGREREELKVIWDQVGTPTYAMDLAAAIYQIVSSQSKAYGTYHYSNEGLTSWYDFTKAIFELKQISARVIPVRNWEYATKAKRPAFTVLDKTKIKSNLTLDIPHWRESLKVCLQNL